MNSSTVHDLCRHFTESSTTGRQFRGALVNSAYVIDWKTERIQLDGTQVTET